MIIWLIVSYGASLLVVKWRATKGRIELTTFDFWFGFLYLPVGIVVVVLSPIWRYQFEQSKRVRPIFWVPVMWIVTLLFVYCFYVFVYPQREIFPNW